MKDIYAALEIGTSRTVLAIGETDSNNQLRITAHAEIPSTGVRKSQILDIPQATQSIKSVLRGIERNLEAMGSKITIGNAFLVVSGQHIKATQAQGNALVGSQVGEDELNEVLRSAHALPIPRDRELLDIIDQDYILDNLSGITTPRGMSGKVLKLNVLQIHADANRLQNARTAADAAHLEIRDSLFAATCAADVVLEDYEKKNGVLVIDLGGGSTGYAAYCDGYPVTAGTIGVGGDHITNDIAHAFQTTNAQAEGMKVNEAMALLSAATDNDSARVRVEQGENILMDTRTVSRRALNTVVNARLMELFTIIRETLEDMEILHRLHAGVVLTGGGARMRDIEALAEQVLGLSTRTGRPIHVGLPDDIEFPPAFAATAGALLYASRNYEEKSFLDGILGRFMK